MRQVRNVILSLEAIHAVQYAIAHHQVEKPSGFKRRKQAVAHPVHHEGVDPVAAPIEKLQSQNVLPTFGEGLDVISLTTSEVQNTHALLKSRDHLLLIEGRYFIALAPTQAEHLGPGLGIGCSGEVVVAELSILLGQEGPGLFLVPHPEDSAGDIQDLAGDKILGSVYDLTVRSCYTGTPWAVPGDEPANFIADRCLPAAHETRYAGRFNILENASAGRRVDSALFVTGIQVGAVVELVEPDLVLGIKPL